ncbi:hypothetical protein L211DRAFT_834035 [Terfezia boudieri ATCC MYA-4762]|uniref:Uncharacterized protein n=1 Tax=Terfezia boudieri ATCC MYA-4762 TaxID=1051890 RepID=A0A3N4M3V3_9PEZI|nr:hypothetical protein L211DRAFT_834035 [Terfezia boudieri ATCC MYA-4762]
MELRNESCYYTSYTAKSSRSTLMLSLCKIMHVLIHTIGSKNGSLTKIFIVNDWHPYSLDLNPLNRPGSALRSFYRSITLTSHVCLVVRSY